HISRHRDADTAQQLDPLRDEVDQVRLLLVMLVEQQMELVERLAGHLPVMLLVQVANRDGVGQRLVQRLHAPLADRLLQADRKRGDAAVLLELLGTLSGVRPGAGRASSGRGAVPGRTVSASQSVSHWFLLQGWTTRRVYTLAQRSTVPCEPSHLPGARKRPSCRRRNDSRRRREWRDASGARA